VNHPPTAVGGMTFQTVVLG